LKKKSKDSYTFPVQVLSLGNGAEALIQANGSKFDLSLLEPYVELFSSEYFTPSDDKSEVVDDRTGTSIPVSIFRASYEDGSTLLVEKDGRDGRITYAEVRRPRGEPQTADIFLVPETEVGSGSETLLAFTPEDIDVDLLNSKFSYGEVLVAADEEDSYDDRLLRTEGREKQQEQLVSTNYRRSGGSFSTATWSTICPRFQVVNIAIVFDSEFCAKYGSFSEARKRIMTIVASASFHYER
jgi:hypothetical protein